MSKYYMGFYRLIYRQLYYHFLHTALVGINEELLERKVAAPV
jgi:hypothetical protein